MGTYNEKKEERKQDDEGEVILDMKIEEMRINEVKRNKRR